MAGGLIEQGDIYVIDLGEPFGSEPGYSRPYVVLQNDVLNASPIRTVLLCAITSNMRRARARGNVIIEAGEGGLPHRSVVNVSQVVTVDKARLTDYRGGLSRRRMAQIASGLLTVIQPRDAPSS